MKKFVIAIGTACVVAACVPAQNETFIAPSGGQASTTKCSQSPQACYKVATETCRGPYRVLDSYSKAGGLLADVIPGPVTWYYMSYECGRSDGSFPQFALRGATPAMPAASSTSCTRLGNTVNCQSF